MKKGMRYLLIAAIAVFSMNGFAQEQKLGHVNIDELIMEMPETQAANTEMQQFQESLQNDMKTLEEEYQGLVAEIQNGQQNGWSELMLKSKEEDLYTKQQKIMAFQQQAQEQLVAKERELMQPIIEKLQNAVNAVATEKGFTYVLDGSASKGVVIFKDNGEDIGPLVKAKLSM